jgi:DNA-directed RNA polymerase
MINQEGYIPMYRVRGTVEEQLELEKMKEEEAVSKHVRDLDKAIQRGDFSSTPYGVLLTKLGYEQYVEKLEEYLTLTLRTHTKRERDLLLLITDDMREVGYITLMECINASVLNKSLASASIDVVSKLRDIFLMNKLKRDNPKLHTYLGDKFRRASKRGKRLLLKKHIDKLYKLGDSAEDKATMTSLGSTLINILELSGANIIEVVRQRKDNSNRFITRLKLSEEAEQVITNLEYSDLISATVNKLPLIVPPKDWTTNHDGGWYKGKNFLFTVRSGDVSRHLKNNTYPKIYNVINKLHKTSWRVNVEMYDLVQHIFMNNMIDPKSPTLAPYLYGELPTSIKYTWEDFIKQEEYEEWHLFNRAREDLTIRLQAEDSKRLDLMYSLSVAEKMKQYEKMWYTYVIDYRNRIYCDVNFLNPQGQHYVKAMLEFGDGQYLTDDGIHWLKIHTANVYGKDKEEYEDRLSWFEDNEDTILNIALDPLANLKDWVWADSPYEYVAACKAWRDHKAGDLVYLPIQLDATCSGIQMYSGLLRDKPGAESVNVIGNTRNDIYQIVADKVNDKLRVNDFPQWVEYKDREGVEKSIYSATVGKSMVDKISRKIVKRNVMTVPYSVTRKGMSNQLWDMIDDAELKNKPFWEGDKWVANKLLTHLNHECIYDTIEGAKKGQEYLVGLTNNLEGPATWTGVLYDFPVRQTALDLQDVRVKTVYGTLRINVEVPSLNKRRQRNSIAPNFIHNIDSTILMYCIDNMQEQIGVIHDCFLVHPNDGYTIQDWYKEAFIEVMKADPLRNIQKQIDPEGKVEFPEYGELNLDEVRDSRYIIS